MRCKKKKKKNALLCLLFSPRSSVYSSKNARFTLQLPYEVLKCAYLMQLPRNIYLWKKKNRRGRRKKKTTLRAAANNQHICPHVNCK